MRRLVSVVVVLAVAGCSVLRDAFSAHPGEAARAAGQTLSVERLAGMASHVKGMPLQASNLSQLAGIYVDYTLFAMALANGDSLRDTAVMGRAMWPMVSQLKFDHFYDGLSANQQPTGGQLDSLYATGDFRAFQHVLIAVPQNAAPPLVQQKQRQIDGLWHALVSSGGANFAVVAKRSSEDPGSKAAGGYLGVAARGRFVPQFEDAAWQLQPGAMSGVVRTAFGFHVIRRPPLAEIRDSFAEGVRRVLMSRFDSTYLADLDARREIRVSSNAGETVRAALQDLEDARQDSRRIASYRGGGFAVKDLVRWLSAINPRFAQALPMQSDSQITLLVQQIVERDIALQQADSARVQLTDSEWTEVRKEYDSTLAILANMLGYSAAMLRDSAATPDARARFMMARVNDYFDRVVGGQAQFFPVPPLLAQWLRERSDWSIDATGVQRAAERAASLRAGADSLRPPGAGNQGAQVRPAPGPPPVPPVPDSVVRRLPSRRVVQ